MPREKQDGDKGRRTSRQQDVREIDDRLTRKGPPGNAGTAKKGSPNLDRTQEAEDSNDESGPAGKADLGRGYERDLTGAGQGHVSSKDEPEGMGRSRNKDGGKSGKDAKKGGKQPGG